MELYHYYERSIGPFRMITELPMDAAKALLLQKSAEGKFHHPNIDGFLARRYDHDRRLREAFIKRGGKPTRTAPIYMMLGAHPQWESAYDEAAVIKIPLDAFARAHVSFTYGDSFAVFDPILYRDKEYGQRVYFADEILALIERLGMPKHVDYDFKRGIYPTDMPINHHLKYVEAQVWDDTVIDRYR